MAFVAKRRRYTQMLGKSLFREGPPGNGQNGAPLLSFGHFSSAQPQKQDTHWLVDSLAFKVAVTGLVAMNSLVMGVEVDHPELEHVWDVFEHIFTVGFVVEMVIKVSALGRKTYIDSTSNRLDAFLVAAAVVDLWILSPIGINFNMQMWSLLRWFRGLRLVRLAKVVFESKKLVLICEGLIETLKITFYVGFLLLLTIYACAIFCVEMIGRQEEYPGYAVDMQEINDQEVMANFNPHLCFGSLGAAMLTLFNIATTTEWSEIIRPISVVQPGMTCFFLLFMLTIGFGLMNVIIGMVVDNMLEQSESMKKQEGDECRRKKIELIKQLETFFESGDEDHDEHLTASEIEHLLGRADIQMLLRKFRLPEGFTSREFLHLLDQSGDGNLTHTDFISGLYRLLDSDVVQLVCALQASVNHIKFLVRQSSASIQSRLDALEAGREKDARSPRLSEHSGKDRDEEIKLLAQDGQADRPIVGTLQGLSSASLTDGILGDDKDAYSANITKWNTVLHKKMVTSLMTRCLRSWRLAITLSKQEAAADKLHGEVQAKPVVQAGNLSMQRLRFAKMFGQQLIMIRDSHTALVCWHSWRSVLMPQFRSRKHAARNDDETVNQVAIVQPTSGPIAQTDGTFTSASAANNDGPPASDFRITYVPRRRFEEEGGTLACTIGTPLTLAVSQNPMSGVTLLPSSKNALAMTAADEASRKHDAAVKSCTVMEKEVSRRELQPRVQATTVVGKANRLEAGAGSRTNCLSLSHPVAREAATVNGMFSASVAAVAELDRLVLEARSLQVQQRFTAPGLPTPLPAQRVPQAVNDDAISGSAIHIEVEAEDGGVVIPVNLRAKNCDNGLDGEGPKPQGHETKASEGT